jgi:hypothetical protein
MPIFTRRLLSAAMPRLLRFMLPCALVVFAAPFIALCFYSSPAADDFCKATLSFNTVPQPSVLAVTWLYYTQWSPRWLTTFLESLIMSHVDLAAAYGWLLSAVILGNVASLWYFFGAVFRFPRATALLAAGVFYAAWAASIVNPDEQLYWLTGSMEYNLSLCAMLALVGLLFRPRRTAWYYVLIVLLSIAVPAQHEIAGMVICAILLAGTIILWMKHIPARHWRLSLGAAALSLAAVILSPGTAARAAMEHKQLWDTAHTLRWTAHAFYNGFGWLANPAILLAACCIVLLAETSGMAGGASLKAPKWLGLALLGAMMALLCAVALVEIATGTWAPPRVVAWFQFVFWILFLCVVLTGMPEVLQIRFSPGTRAGIFALFAVILLGSPHFRAALGDLRGPAQSWHRIGVSRLAQHGGSLEFEASPQSPHLAKPQMLTADPGCWVNRCLANYLHAETVVVRNAADVCPH